MGDITALSNDVKTSISEQKQKLTDALMGDPTDFIKVILDRIDIMQDQINLLNQEIEFLKEKA